MFYKPKYCSNCSDKIERVHWNLLTSEKFCELCETNFRTQEWLPRIAGLILAIFGFAGLIGYLRNDPKPLKISADAAVAKVAAPNRESANQAPVRNLIESRNNNAAQNLPNAATVSREQSAAPPALTQNTQPKSAKNQPNVAEAVYFCGAETKKGTPCSRKVKGGGRCWQHENQKAMLPNEKLIANQ